METQTYHLTSTYDRRYGPKRLPMVTLDFELTGTEDDDTRGVVSEFVSFADGEGHRCGDGAYFCYDLWLN